MLALVQDVRGAGPGRRSGGRHRGPRERRAAHVRLPVPRLRGRPPVTATLAHPGRRHRRPAGPPRRQRPALARRATPSSMIGDSVYYMALSWAAVQAGTPLAGRAGDGGQRACRARVLMLGGGVVADRFGPRSVVIGSDARALRGRARGGGAALPHRPGPVAAGRARPGLRHRGRRVPTRPWVPSPRASPSRGQLAARPGHAGPRVSASPSSSAPRWADSGWRSAARRRRSGSPGC